MARKTRKKTKKRSSNKYSDKIVVRAKTKGQKRYIQDIKSSEITFCCGPAGSGKTAVAVGLGLQYVTAAQSGFDQIIVMRPVKEACGENLGYLPGDLGEKMEPWAAPILDNMRIFINPAQIKNLFYQKKVEIVPLAYARGRSLNRSYVIIDEAQNCSKEQFLMLLTRLGDKSKMVINGDLSQSDTPKEGLSDAMQRLSGIDGVSMCRMTNDDIVRNPLISKIIERYQG